MIDYEKDPIERIKELEIEVQQYKDFILKIRQLFGLRDGDGISLMKTINHFLKTKKEK